MGPSQLGTGEEGVFQLSLVPESDLGHPLGIILRGANSNMYHKVWNLRRIPDH